MSHEVNAPTDARNDLTAWQQLWRRLLLPSYIGQPWRFEEGAWVRDRTTPLKRPCNLSLGYYLLVEFHSHRDCQTLYPNWWRTRRQWVRVSRQLYEADPIRVNIFYQFHNHLNYADSVRVKIAQ